MNAQMKWKVGDVKYQVSYCPSDHAEKVKAKDEESWPGDDMLVMTFLDFRSAETFAHSVVGNDFFGCVSIHKEVCENTKYDWWENYGAWHITKDDKPGSLNPEIPHEN